jgi:hypothetical protein
MSNDISEEAKTSLAAVRDRKAAERLRRAGAESRPAMQRRVLALATERGIPPADYAKLMYKRGGTAAFMAFCKKHNVSTDWLLCGDLKGLQRMTQWAKAEPRADTSQQMKAVLDAFGKLDAVGRKALAFYLQSQL